VFSPCLSLAIWGARSRWPATRPMRHLFAIFLISTCGCWGSDHQSMVERFRMRATVQDVIVLQQFTGMIVPAHVDPRFALTLRIESIAPPLAGFGNGSTVTFAIHSPMKLFAGATPKSKALDFVLWRERVPGKETVFRLELEVKDGQPAVGADPARPVPAQP